MIVNAHNILWNCHVTDRNGSNLAEESENKGLSILNTNAMSRIGEGGRQWANLDLIFCTADMVNRITYKQKKDTWGSDHFPITFNIDEDIKAYSKKTNKITNKKTDWIQFEENLVEGLEEIKEIRRNKAGHLEVYDKVYKTIISAAATDKENIMNAEITKEETKRAIGCCKKSSAPGLDHIEYEMIRRLNDEYIEIMTEIFNDCIKTNKYPEQWKEYQVIFIDKPDKEKVIGL